jgi:RNA polymerase sigma-70 factor (ECF subfamily)
VTQIARWRRSRRGKLALSIHAEETGSAIADPSSDERINIGSDEPDTAESVARRLDVQAALLRLSDEHRAVLVLREFEGMSYEEMAEALDVPRGTVESRLHRARAELRTRLKSYLP